MEVPAMNPLRRTVVAAVLLLAPALAGCATDRQVVAQAEGVHQEIEPAVIRDPQLQNYVQKLGDRIVSAARDMHQAGEVGGEEWMFQDVNFHLVNSPTVNAFTTGGKHVYLYTGLFEQSNTEDGFAAVVGHEFGHIVGRHVQGGMNRQLGLLAAAGGAAAVGALVADEDSRTQTAAAAGGIALAGGQLVGLKFGRDDELQADELGFDFYARAGYDPDTFPEFFQNMVEQGNDVSGFQEYLSSHPSLSRRVDNAREMTQAWKRNNPNWQSYLRPDVVSQSAFDRLQARAVEFAEDAPQDTTLGQAQALLAAFPQCVDPE